MSVLPRSTQAFLPNLCALQPVFILVLLGELLAVALVLADRGITDFEWVELGIISFLVQWIVLLSAALLCPLRGWLGTISPWLAGLVGYVLVLVVVAVCTAIGSWLMSAQQSVSANHLLTSLSIAAIVAGIALRYLYLQQQLNNQKEAELRARIAALQARIRPHFLFNSMNSIASLIEVEPVKAEKMVVDLACLFRASLAEPGLVSLREELALCRRYIAIEQLRLGDRLQLDWPDADIGDKVKIPSLLLQPIVENAVYHGIQPRPEGGTVAVQIKQQGDDWVIEISNPEPDATVQSSRVVEEGSLGNRVALENIRNRLQAYYGHRAHLQAYTQGGVFVTRLQIPTLPDE